MQRSQPKFALLLATEALVILWGAQALGQSQPTALIDGGRDGSVPAQPQWAVSGVEESPARETRTDAADALPFASQRVADQPPNAFLGNRLLADAVRQIAQHGRIAANIRHRIQLFDHELVGSGTYQQMDIGSDRLLRLELKIPLDDQITSLIQVCDARFLWLQRTMPDGRGGEQTEISRIDLNKVKSAAAGDLGQGGIRRRGLLLGRGGLPQLLIELEQHFAFHEVRAAKYHEMPVWITWGQWKPEVLTRLFPDNEAGNDKGMNIDMQRLARLPLHVPHTATVVLGREDLLPYRFEYRRKKDADDVREGLAVLDNDNTEPIVTMELYDVDVGGFIDAKQFTFSADDYVDKTREYLMRASQGK